MTIKKFASENQLVNFQDVNAKLEPYSFLYGDPLAPKNTQLRMAARIARVAGTTPELEALQNSKLTAIQDAIAALQNRQPAGDDPRIEALQAQVAALTDALIEAEEDMAQSVALNIAQSARLDALDMREGQLADGADQDYRLIQGQNLIPNGYLEADPNSYSTYDDEEGSVDFVTYDPDRSELIIGSESAKTLYGKPFLIDGKRPIRFDLVVKGDAGSRMYCGLQFLDANGRIMEREHIGYFPGTVTTLTQPFAPGDKVLHADNLLDWRESSSNSGQGVAFVDYQDGKVIVTDAVSGYTRFAHNDTRDKEGGGGCTVSRTKKTLTFKHPVTLPELFDNGRAWPAGTKIRQPYSRGETAYTVFNCRHDDTYKSFRRVLYPVRTGASAGAFTFGPDARYARWAVLANYGADAPTQQFIRELKAIQ